MQISVPVQLLRGVDIVCINTVNKILSPIQYIITPICILALRRKICIYNKQTKKSLSAKSCNINWTAEYLQVLAHIGGLYSLWFSDADFGKSLITFPCYLQAIYSKQRQQE